MIAPIACSGDVVLTVLVWLLAVVGLIAIILLAITGALRMLDLLDSEVLVRRVWREAADAETQIHAHANTAQRAMHEEAQRYRPASGTSAKR